jgi:hypothetical protein
VSKTVGIASHIGGSNVISIIVSRGLSNSCATFKHIHGRPPAKRYLRLARSSDDALERGKLLGYAAMYADLAEQSVRQEALKEWIDFKPNASGSLKRTGS